MIYTQKFGSIKIINKQYLYTSFIHSMNRGKNYDNISNPSKSSKTIRTKFIVNKQEQVKTPRIYFRDDPLKEQMVLRAKKQNNRISPQPKKQPVDHLKKVSKLVADLHKKKQDARKRLDHLKQEAQKQMDKKHPFSPQKKRISKYVVTGDVVRRNQVWLQEKARRQLHLKQQRTIQELKNCTFTPVMQSKKQSEAILKYKTGRSVTPTKSPNKHDNSLNSFYSPVKGRKKDISFQQFQTAKKFLVSKIMNTHIL